ncbi:MAG: M20 family metallopeptidase, partial [Thermoanaerobaculia bacterium]
HWSMRRRLRRGRSGAGSRPTGEVRETGDVPDLEAMLADLELLVNTESPSNDIERLAASADALALIIDKRLGTGVEVVPGSAGAHVRWSGGDRPRVLLVGHHDTVFPIGALESRPFAVADGRVTGPGVFDMKGGVAVALAVLTAIGAGVLKPARGISLFLSCDEEVGSETTREHFVEEARRRDRVLVLEPSGDGGAAKIARKGIGLVQARFQGIASHAGLEPDKGASALLELARFVLFAETLGNRALETSMVSTVAQAGTRTNVVPERADVSVDFRVWSSAEADRLMEALTSYRPVDPRVSLTLEGGLNRPPMESTPESLLIHEQAGRIAARLGFELPAVRVGGASDGNLTAAAGVPTLDGLGPAGGGAHARSEHLVVEDLPRRAALLAALLEEVSA